MAPRTAPALSVLVASSLLVLALTPSPAAAELSDRKIRKIDDAARVLGEFMGRSRDREIPRELFRDAECVLVLPDVAKGAFGIGGRYGKGLATCRLEGEGWSPPAFFEIGGFSIGFQAGGEYVDLLLVVQDRRGINALLGSKVTLGADASVAAGPYGRTGQAATDGQLKATMLSWSRTRGLFAGVSLDGAVLKQDKSDNRALYGRKTSARKVLLPKEGELLPMPAATEPFMQAIRKHVPPRASAR
jgi:lipid-binding SYLF domain-containing protein